jgi:rhodanese-related sulfurtransferase
MSLLSFLGLTKKEPIDMTNAFILDVRSPGEYASGHVAGSVNIPLQSLSGQLAKVPKDKKIVTCCASGMRSASAASILRSAGYDAVNGGSWANLR